MCLRLLGQAPTDLGGGVIRIAWLRETFNQLLLSASPESIELFARAYALSLMGGVLFPDRFGGSVHLQSALQMTQSSSLGGDFGGWSTLLMIWTWERFLHTTPLHIETGAQITEDAVPRGLRWLPAHTCKHGDQFYMYKLWFDECTTFVSPGLQRYCDPVRHVSSSSSVGLLLIDDVASSKSRARTVWNDGGPASSSTSRS
ncbi:unnamed protein product [Linum tenue]|uniref:Aminotransferase-like plant mobile domain-containing protein n=1 Tax=Linum tenue TaxID=586396 RepID=A0AAV0I4M8_9ROSI|nr:unnamed protein product [Linum tenue]